MEKAQDEKRYIWLDLETTGLDPKGGKILELAMFATDSAGNPVGNPFECTFRYLRDDIIGVMNDHVLKMHFSSGLLEDVWGPAKKLSPTDATNDHKWASAIAWIKRVTRGDKRNTYLAGNSIHFDRSWLAYHCPWMLDSVSHRMLDVSSFLIVRPDLRRVGEPAHRAMADAQESANTFFEHFHRLLQQGAPLTSTN